MINKEIEFARFLFNNEQISEPIYEQIIYGTLGGKHLHYYEYCIKQGMTHKEYMLKFHKGANNVSELKLKTHDKLCLNKEIADKYKGIHNKYPELKSHFGRRRSVCELDFAGLDTYIVGRLSTAGIDTIEVLLRIIHNNPNYLLTIRGIGEKYFDEIINWSKKYQ